MHPAAFRKFLESKEAVKLVEVLTSQVRGRDIRVEPWESSGGYVMSRKRSISQTEPTMDGPHAIKCSLETTLERESDGVDNATHARLDKAVLDTTGDYAFSPPFLLATIVSTSKGMLDLKYEKNPEAKALLQEHPQLEVELKNAWEQEPKSFKDIQNLSMSCVIL